MFRQNLIGFTNHVISDKTFRSSVFLDLLGFSKFFIISYSFIPVACYLLFGWTLVSYVGFYRSVAQGYAGVQQPVPATNPFGTLPAMPQMSIGRGGTAPSIQYGISSMPVR